ncbi:MAG: YceI family protein [Flavobacteriaceae bacterium]
MQSFYKTLSALLVLTMFITSYKADDTETRPLTVESNHSTVQFIVPISNGITRVTGKFNEYSIDIDYNDEDFTQSTISATIKVESIDTGIDARDDHLLTVDFFDVEQFPEITFISEEIIKKDDSFLIKGKFTMHGVSKTIEFPLIITGKEGENTIGFSSRLTLNRVDYGVGADFKHSSMENFLSEDIHVEIDFWTKKKKI